jgi:hypothetical protein
MSRLLALLAGVALLMASTASAGSITGALPVSASVNAVCAIDMTGKQLAFGVYDPSDAGGKTAGTTLAVRCTAGTTANMSIQDGGSGRKMTSASKTRTLNYTAALVSGATSGDSISPVADASGNVTASVSGNIPAAQYVPAAADYADSMVINVTF